jgi:hypothetical protein
LKGDVEIRVRLNKPVHKPIKGGERERLQGTV